MKSNLASERITDLDRRYIHTYDGDAHRYDQRSFGSVAGEFSKRYKNELIVELLQKHGCFGESSVILDCPSGTGRVTHFLVSSEHLFDQVYACDISENMLGVNQENLPGRRESVSFHIADIKSLPLDDNSISAAIVASFLYLVPLAEYPQYVADIYRVLKPGGIAIVEVSNTFPAYNPKNVGRVVSQRFIQRRKVKSYITPFEFKSAFQPFGIIGYRGAEFPLISRQYSIYRAWSRSLGNSPVFRWFSGKFTVVLRKGHG